VVFFCGLQQAPARRFARRPTPRNGGARVPELSRCACRAGPAPQSNSRLSPETPRPVKIAGARGKNPNWGPRGHPPRGTRSARVGPREDSWPGPPFPGVVLRPPTGGPPTAFLAVWRNTRPVPQFRSPLVSPSAQGCHVLSRRNCFHVGLRRDILRSPIAVPPEAPIPPARRFFPAAPVSTHFLFGSTLHRMPRVPPPMPTTNSPSPPGGRRSPRLRWPPWSPLHCAPAAPGTSRAHGVVTPLPPWEWRCPPERKRLSGWLFGGIAWGGSACS